MDISVITCGVLFFSGVCIFHVSTWADYRIHGLIIPLGIGSFIGGVALILVLFIWWPVLAGKAMIFVCIPSLLFAVVSLDFSCRPVPSSLHWIGASTYAVYLIHMPVIFIFMLFGLQRWAESPWLLTVFFGLTI